MASAGTGASPASSGPPGPNAADLDTFPPVFSLLGGSGLAAGAFWQRAAGPEGRVFVLMAPSLSEGRSALRERDRALQGMP